jgi:hypothetical protein
MAGAIERNDSRALTDQAWLRNARSSFDVHATLSSALTPIWTVEREEDPSGELSIVILPANDAASQQTFILYEEDGTVRLSTFLGESWQCRWTFADSQRAVAAVIRVAALTAVR